MTSSKFCAGSSPSDHRAFVEGIMFGDVELSFTAAPDRGFSVGYSMHTPAGDSPISAHAGYIPTAGGLRAGSVDIVAAVAPPQMFCNSVSTTMPVTGPLTVQLSCLSDGLPPALFL